MRQSGSARFSPSPDSGFRVQGSWFKVQGSGFALSSDYGTHETVKDSVARAPKWLVLRSHQMAGALHPVTYTRPRHEIVYIRRGRVSSTLARVRWSSSAGPHRTDMNRDLHSPAP